MTFFAQEVRNENLAVTTALLLIGRDLGPYVPVTIIEEATVVYLIVRGHEAP
jgi:hypothetical protein